MPKKQVPVNSPLQEGFEAPMDILMDAPIGIYTSTPEGRFLAANPAMAAMFGYESPQDLLKCG